MQARSRTHVAAPIGGSCHSAFEPVEREFRRNFTERGEVGAAVCVYHRGQPVVDLWGGHKDPARQAPWDADTVVCMMSVGKALAALSVLMLVDRGRIALEEPVTAYWKEFGAAGKAGITVRELLGGRAGLIYCDAATAGAIFRWDEMVRAIELQRPEWPPGSRGAYHSTNYGFLAGELVRRVDGRPFARFVDEDICGPLGVEYRFGLSSGELARVAEIVPNDASATVNLINQPESKLARAWRVRPKGNDFLYNTPEWRSAVVPSGNGHSNARACARIFAALAQGGEIGGVRLVGADLVEQARQVQWEGECGLTGRNYRYGLGFFLNKAPLTYFGPNPRAFGHPGLGGAVGIADPENAIAFSYSPNWLCAGEGLGDRCEALIRAAFECNE